MKPAERLIIFFCRTVTKWKLTENDTVQQAPSSTESTMGPWSIWTLQLPQSLRTASGSGWRSRAKDQEAKSSSVLTGIVQSLFRNTAFCASQGLLYDYRRVQVILAMCGSTRQSFFAFEGYFQRKLLNEKLKYDSRRNIFVFVKYAVRFLVLM